jgi:hypothetical protein
MLVRLIVEAGMFKNKPVRHLIAILALGVLLILVTVQFSYLEVNLFKSFDFSSFIIILLSAVIYGYGSYQIFNHFKMWRESKRVV